MVRYALWVSLALGLSACVGSGDLPTQVSGQIVGDDLSPLGPGLVMIERGVVHQGSYEVGALIGEDGRFSAALAGGGVWGIHLFHNDYLYLPGVFGLNQGQQIVLTNVNIVWGDWLDRTGLPTWPDQPSDATQIRMQLDDSTADNPVILDIAMAYAGSDILQITVDVTDPNSDLSRMILAHDTATGGGYALNPPAPPVDGNYPNGTYSLSVFLDERHQPGVTDWYFVVSDNLCNNSPIERHTMPAL